MKTITSLNEVEQKPLRLEDLKEAMKLGEKQKSLNNLIELLEYLSKQNIKEIYLMQNKLLKPWAIILMNNLDS